MAISREFRAMTKSMKQLTFYLFARQLNPPCPGFVAPFALCSRIFLNYYHPAALPYLPANKPGVD
jgi:hypothetical protein